MTLVLAILTVFPRPAYEPIGPAELARVSELMQGYDRAVTEAATFRVEDAVPGRFVVGVESGSSSDAKTFIVMRGGVVVRDATEAGFLVAEFPTETDAATLEREAEAVEGVRYFETDCRVRITRFPNDPLFARYQWD